MGRRSWTPQNPTHLQPPALLQPRAGLKAQLRATSPALQHRPAAGSGEVGCGIREQPATQLHGRRHRAGRNQPHGIGRSSLGLGQQSPGEQDGQHQQQHPPPAADQQHSQHQQAHQSRPLQGPGEGQHPDGQGHHQQGHQGSGHGGPGGVLRVPLGFGRAPHCRAPHRHHWTAELPVAKRCAAGPVPCSPGQHHRRGRG